MIITLAPAASANEIGALFINEVCTKNNGTNGNEDTQVLNSGDYCDYIELYNSSDHDIDISGYGITDDRYDIFKGIVMKCMPFSGFRLTVKPSALLQPTVS